MQLIINGLIWNVYSVDPWDDVLWTGNEYTLGVTDLDRQEIYIADNLEDYMLFKVLGHELCHAIAYSYGYSMPVPSEECMCDMIANHDGEVTELMEKLI